ncbi:MAG TPA: trypsin-like serine protease [Kofleriaceae bacterium]
MRLAPAVLWLLVPSAALAAPSALRLAPRPHVIGGENAADGAWPDAAAIMFPDMTGDEALCSGTLIAPTVVITAGHCYDPTDPPLPDNVLIGTTSLARPDDGETIAIQQGFVHPNPETTEDVTVLILAQPSKLAPRALATGWAATDIVNGAAVELVGYGAINKDGDDFIDELQQAATTISDADCTKSSGCNVSARPDGELGAGGDGIDTCPGDSGGPLYLTTKYGSYLAGVTSRSYDDAKVSCSGGGIYVRPDKIADWIEQVAGVPVMRAPGPSAGAITADHGASGDSQIAVDDPGSTRHDFEVTAQPAHGKAAVRDDGLVRVCPDATAAAGTDQVTVKITDSTNSHRALSLTIPVTVTDGGSAPGCDLAGFDTDGGGCCDAGGRAGASIPLALGVVALIARPRRRRRS